MDQPSLKGYVTAARRRLASALVLLPNSTVRNKVPYQLRVSCEGFDSRDLSFTAIAWTDLVEQK